MPGHTSEAGQGESISALLKCRSFFWLFYLLYESYPQVGAVLICYKNLLECYGNFPNR